MYDFIRVENTLGVTHYSTKYYIQIGNKICVNDANISVIAEIK